MLKTLVMIAVTAGWCVPVSGNGLWGEQEFGRFCDALERPPKSRLLTALGDYVNIVTGEEGVELDYIRSITAEDIFIILDKAIAYGWDSVSLFSDEHFLAGQACVLFVEQTVLEAVDAKYDLQTLWMINAVVSRDNRRQLGMKYLLLGRGHLIIGYDGSGTVRVRAYDIYTGLYEYSLYTSMRIINNSERRGLFDIGTRNDSDGSRKPFIGPLNAIIKSVELRGTDQLLVRYSHLIGSKKIVDRKLIKKRNVN